MSIIYPREMPYDTDTECTFELDPGTVQYPQGNGHPPMVTKIRDSLWSASFATVPLNLVERAEWQAWYNSLHGGLKKFLGWDITRHQPLGYPNGVPAIRDGTWDGTATVEDLGTPGLISVSGVPAGFILLPGDRVGLTEGERFGYFEISTKSVADPDGTMELPVHPWVSSVFSTAATAVLFRPRCRMAIISQSFSCPGVPGLARVSFQAVEAF
ncbi:MAG: hypothetical protein CME90_05895 [Hoeflea sp.]|nr:hypothetical protein [Hoeflea sp.]|tara:strand:+ start:2503 stop:3141 length:639 start_codon:yes stop_codon:yes gene_type:complete